MKYLLYILASFLLMMTACDKDSVRTDEEEDCLKIAGDVLLPLTEGNYWISEQLFYSEGQVVESDRDTGKLVIEKLMTIQFEGEEYEVGVRNLHFPVDRPGDLNWLFWNGPDGLYSMGGMSSYDTLITKVLDLKYPVEVGESWKFPRLVYDGEFRFADTVTYTLVAKDEEYETPMGTFRCLVYYHWIRPGGVLAKWHYFTYYTPGIGKVGNLIYSIFDTTYSYNNRDVNDLKWKTTMFDYCLELGK